MEMKIKNLKCLSHTFSVLTCSSSGCAHDWSGPEMVIF